MAIKLWIHFAIPSFLAGVSFGGTLQEESGYFIDLILSQMANFQASATATRSELRQKSARVLTFDYPSVRKLLKDMSARVCKISKGSTIPGAKDPDVSNIYYVRLDIGFKVGKCTSIRDLVAP